MIDNNAQRDRPQVLAVNAGSSSIKFALYDTTEPLRRRVRGKIERIGLPETALLVDDATGARILSHAVDAPDHSSAAGALMEWLEEARLRSAVQAVGHRVVHGGSRYSAPARVNDELLQALREISVYSPEHLPGEIALIAKRKR